MAAAGQAGDPGRPPIPKAPLHCPKAPLHWWSTLLYVPLLYGLGWLSSRPLAWVAPNWRPDQLDLAGVAISLILLLASLPWRLRRLWGSRRPWQTLGLAMPPQQALLALGRGLLKAALLLLAIALALLISGRARWLGELGMGALLNALALALGVGFAEELLFRGWLWGELELQLGARRALAWQAAVFALVHPWYHLAPAGALALLFGLVLLALALALQRRADGGCLWGAIGLHGGLVGSWFALQAGLLQISPATPAWLIGPGAPSPNPVGGLLGWTGLAALIWIRRRHWKSNPGYQLCSDQSCRDQSGGDASDNR
jgi:membrane protease YdiL (CAAX protease family)